MHENARFRSHGFGRVTLRAFGILGVVALTLMAITGVVGAAERGAANPDAVVMTVNGTPVTASQFYTQLEKKAGAQVLDMIVTDILVRQAAVASGITATADDINRQFAAIKAQFPSDADYQAALKKYGITEAELLAEVELNLIVQRLAAKDVKVTDEEVAKYFEEHKDEYSTPAKVRARHILLQTEAEAKDVLAQLQSGADFAELAKKYSIDTGSKDNGGELGFFTEDQVVPEFGNAAFALKVGETSGIVQSQYGFHIIQAEEKQDAKAATLADVQGLIRQQLTDERTPKPEEVIAQLKEKASFDVKWDEYRDVFAPPADSQASPAEAEKK